MNNLSSIHNLSAIPSFIKSDTVLTVPGQFSFQLEDDDIKLGKNSTINKRMIEEIIENIRAVFKCISKNLDEYYKKFDYNYYTSIIKKLNRFANSPTLRFPGLQVINMSRDHLEIFSKVPDRVLICEKSDGVRYLLIHSTNGKVLFLGRNLEFYLVDLNDILPMSRNSNNNHWEIENLLDGELIIDKVEEEVLRDRINSNVIKIGNEYFEVKFIIFDAIVVLGENIGHFKFRDRLKMLSKFFFLKDLKRKFNFAMKPHMEYSIFEALASKDKIANSSTNNKLSKFTIEVYMKDYYTFDKTELIYNKFAKLLKHHNDGMIINLDDYPYYSGQSAEIYKWKPANLNTIDFEARVMDFPGNKKLVLLNVAEVRDKMLPVSCLFFKSDEERQSFLNEYEELRMSEKPNVIVECYYDFGFNTDEVINFHMLEEAKIIKKDLGSIGYTSNMSNEGLCNLQSYNFDYFKRGNGNNNTKHLELGAWQFMRFRKDKRDPNSLYTYVQVWSAITENVQMVDIREKLKENEYRRTRLDPNKVLSTFIRESNARHNYFSDDELVTKEITNSTGNTKDQGGNISTPVVSNSNTLNNPGVKSNNDNEGFLNRKRNKPVEAIERTEESPFKGFKIQAKERDLQVGKMSNTTNNNTNASSLSISTPNNMSKKEIKVKKDAEKKERGIKQSFQMLDRVFGSNSNDNNSNVKSPLETNKKYLDENTNNNHTNQQSNKNAYTNSLLDDNDSLEESDSE